MTFAETIQKMGYSIKSNEEGKITIFRDATDMVFYIIFDNNLKVIQGVLQPAALITAQYQLNRLQTCFELLQKEVKELQVNCGYKIV